jgi:hypothetical protein
VRAGTARRLADRGVRVAVVAAAGCLGLLFAVGCVIAALFELQGFGDRDGDPSIPYLLALAAAFVACVAVPVLVWRALLPASAPGVLLAALPAGAVVVILLGLGLER